jgi:carboxyl-terminal processing protease
MMTKRASWALRSGALVAAVAGVLLVWTRVPAEPVPGKQDQLVAKLVTDFLHRGHLVRPEIGDELSRQLFRRFIKDLDPSKGYLLKSDIDEFKKYETELDDQLLQGDLRFAYEVYNRLIRRIAERQKLIAELVKAPQDFTIKEDLNTDYDAIPFAASEAELRERWRKRIKFDLLLQRLGPKPVPEAEARQKILSRYQNFLRRMKQLDNYDLMEIYLSDLTASVDPHSSYMSPNTQDDFSIAMRLNLEGIGALLRQEDGHTIVAEIVPGGAAATDGRLKPKDKIIGVAQGDDHFVDVEDMKLREVVQFIRGPRGTPVQLKVVPSGKVEPVIFNLTRRKIELKSQEARGDIVEDGRKADGTPYRVGVIDLPSFYADMANEDGEAAKSATEDVRQILKSFTAKGVDAVILDLRKNGGGALSEALSLTGLFIDQGPVVQVKDARGKVERGDDPERGTVYDGPLVVLTSRLSASASEILAGALQDYDRALIVGDSSTHGKGTVQAVIDLGKRVRPGDPPRLGALKLTIQQFYRVNGDSTQNRGVTPDVHLPSPTEGLGTGESELEHALAFDRVAPAEHEDLGLIPASLKATLQERSAKRIKDSAEFAKLAKELELQKARHARKAVPLNEKELRDQFSKDEAEKAEQTIEGALPPEPADGKPYKYPRSYINNEALRITEDLVQGKNLAASR